MKIAVLSDIHGNLPALRTVSDHIEQWCPDHVVVNGDVVNRGPLPVPCWQFVRRKQRDEDWLVVEGNHEVFVTDWLKPKVPIGSTYFEIFRSGYWTFQQFNGEVEALTKLPTHISLTDPAGNEVRLTHASMRGNRDGIYPETTDEELQEKIAPAPAVFITSHTHRPLIRTVDDTLVINSGAAGTTFDGDPRASYAQLTWQSGRWQAHIVRLAYDRKQTGRDFSESGYLENSGHLTRVFYHEWLTARPYINQWGQQFEARVLGGEISLEASVQEFLAAIG